MEIIGQVSADIFDGSRSDIDRSETHISVLAFDGVAVHKRKKPVRYAFIDLSTEELRAAMCTREVALNRRFSPDVYLGVEEVVDESGAVIDHAVAMRQMPAERRMSTLVREHHQLSSCLDEVARTIARCHSEQLPRLELSAVATPTALRALWHDNIDELAEFAPRVLHPEALEACRVLADRYIDGRQPLFQRRIDQHMIVDGHGDLLADDIFCLDDGPRILDCLEFDDHLRWGDVLYDVCFLAMDLERLGRADLAAEFLDAYRRHSREEHPRTLEHHYTAYRALVRCKVRCLQGTGAESDASAFLAQCHRHLLEGRVHLVIVGGLPGTGKTTLATELGSQLGWSVLHSDVVRKQLAGIPETVSAASDFETGLYSPANSKAVYATLLSRARSMLANGESVIIDASFSSGHARLDASAAARAASAEFTELRCLLDPHTAASRMQQRHDHEMDPSDADAAIAGRMASQFEPWPTALPVGMLPPVTDVLPRVVDQIRRS